MTIEQRVAKLERQNKWMKCGGGLMKGGTAFLAVLLCLGCTTSATDRLQRLDDLESRIESLESSQAAPDDSYRGYLALRLQLIEAENVYDSSHPRVQALSDRISALQGDQLRVDELVLAEALQTYEAARADLLGRYTRQHPSVKNVEKKIRFIHAEVGRSG